MQWVKFRKKRLHEVAERVQKQIATEQQVETPHFPSTHLVSPSDGRISTMKSRKMNVFTMTE